MERNSNMGVPVKKRTTSRKPTISSQKIEAKPGELVLGNAKLFRIAGKIIRFALYGPENHRSAVISRYIYTKDRKLKKQSILFIKEILQGYGEDDITDTLADEAIQLLFRFEEQVPFPSPARKLFTFVDLFAGIGGFRIALQQLGGECVFTSEWNKEAQKTYYANFGEIPFGDITKEETRKWIPGSFDLLCGGFPCQPFSIAGVVKKESLGRKHGFEDEKQGNLFFYIADIIAKHRPKAFFLENVKNLVSHDKGKTFKVIERTLRDLGYSFYHKVLDGKNYVPQHRQRTFMVGFDLHVFKGKEQFSFPEMPEKRNINLSQIIEKKTDPKYTLSDKLWEYLQAYAKKHKEQGNGFGYGLINPSDKNAYTRTISARYYKDGAEILVPQKGVENPRRLTPKECALLQGYPEHFIYSAVSDAQAYRQFGNSVVVPLIGAIGEKIVEVITKR